MANVPDSRDVPELRADGHWGTGSVAEIVGGSVPDGNESLSSPNEEGEGHGSPDFYSDWYFEMKDLERTKFRRGMLEWRRNYGGERGSSGEDEVAYVGNRLLPETFRVKMLLKKRRKVSVILGISLDAVGIEVEPDSDPGGGALPKGLDTPASVDALEVVGCEVVKRKSRDRTMFEIVNYVGNGSGEGYKKNYFESESVTAEKILEKLHGVFEVKASSLRQDYLEMVHNEKEKRGMRRIFSFGCG